MNNTTPLSVAVKDDGRPPTHLQDANTVGQNGLRQHFGLALTF